MVTKIPYKRQNSLHVAIMRKYCHHLSPKPAAARHTTPPSPLSARRR